MENVFKFLMVLFLFAAPGEGQKFSFGSCSARTTMAGIVIATEFAGASWKEYARTYSLPSHNWICMTYSFTTITASLFYVIQVRGFDKITRSSLAYDGTMSVAGAATSTATNSFILSFSDKFLGGSTTFFIPYSVSKTALVLYSCENVPFGKLETAILLISSTATAADIAAAYNSLANLGIPRHALRRTGVNCV